MLENNVEYKVKGYTNKWALIDSYAGYGLLENSTYGDETCYLVVDLAQDSEMIRYKKGNGELVYLPTIMEVLGETYDGIETALDDLDIDISERVYQMVERARLAVPVDTEALEDIRDTYGYDLYKEALDAVLAKHVDRQSLAARLVTFCKDYDFYAFQDNLEVGQTEEDAILELESQLTDEKAASAILESLLEFQAEGPVDDEKAALVLDVLIAEMRAIQAGVGRPLRSVLEDDRLFFDKVGLCIPFPDGSVGHSNHFYQKLIDTVLPKKDVAHVLDDANARCEKMSIHNHRVDDFLKD